MIYSVIKMLMVFFSIKMFATIYRLTKCYQFYFTSFPVFPSTAEGDHNKKVFHAETRCGLYIVFNQSNSSCVPGFDVLIYELLFCWTGEECSCASPWALDIDPCNSCSSPGPSIFYLRLVNEPCCHFYCSSQIVLLVACMMLSYLKQKLSKMMQWDESLVVVVMQLKKIGIAERRKVNHCTPV